MFGYICIKLLQYSGRAVESTHLRNLHENPSFNFKPYSVISTSATTNQQHSFIVSYLIHSCGLAKEAAISASKKVYFESREKPDSVINVFKNYGFDMTHSSKLVNRMPLVLLSDPKKTLDPKLKFFSSIGISPSDLAKILSSDPAVLKHSLEKQIIPSFEFLKSVLHTNVNVVATIKRSTCILKHDLGRYVAPNMAVLRDHGVPESRISALLKSQPRVLTRRTIRFTENVKELEKMGFTFSQHMFIKAISALMSMTKSTWERKLDVYKRWGWSEGEILLAFRKQPGFMTASEKKIEQVLEFLVNKMGWDISEIAKCPAVVLFSLEKRTIPRCSVIQYLLLKGLIKKNVCLSTLLSLGEMQFINTFMMKHCDKVPELLDIYKRKVDYLELEIKPDALPGWTIGGSQLDILVSKLTLVA